LKKIVASIASLAMTLMALVSLAVLSAPAANAGDSPNIQICHATSAEKNPYNPVTVSKTALVTGKGDNGHGREHEKDIIPPFTYGDPIQTYPGKNWTTENQAIYKNSCSIPLKVVTPVAPTYAAGTCINKDGTVTLADQPTGVRLNFGPKLSGEGLGAAWTVSYVAEEGYTLSSELAGIFTIPVVGPDSSDPNWDAEAGQCKLPNMGAGISSNALILGGGFIGAGLLFLTISLIFTRRRNA
jgi:hypothetical protein